MSTDAMPQPPMDEGLLRDICILVNAQQMREIYDELKMISNTSSRLASTFRPIARVDVTSSSFDTSSTDFDITDSYDTTMLGKYGEDSLIHPMVDQEVWLEVTDPNKKRQVQCMSHNIDIDIHGSSSASSS